MKRSANGRNGWRWIRTERRFALYARDLFTCVYCGAFRPDARRLSLDHVVPREFGGHDSSNLVTACVWCNSRRKGLDDASFRCASARAGVDVRGFAERVRRSIRRRVPKAAGHALYEIRYGRPASGRRDVEANG